ncbi:TetR family transcriptional regulator [Corynebacterium camporealensis]
MQQNISLREQKRRDTRLNIEDAATALVDERGFSSVTVEEICEKAGISRRTFFNYFDSKDTAVLGSPSLDFDQAQKKWFLTTPATDAISLTLELMKQHVDDHHENSEIAQRRRRIARDSELAAVALNRKRAKTTEVMELIAQRLQQDGSLRKLPELDAETEAMIVAGLVREAIWLALGSPDVDCEDPLTERIEYSLQHITNYAKGLSW